MKKILARGALVLLLTGACQTTGAPVIDAPDPSAQAAPPPPTGAVLPAGTDLRVTVTSELDPSMVRRGDTFTLVIAQPLVAVNREVAIPDGAAVTAMVTGVSVSGGRTVFRINFLRINVKGVSHPFTAEIRETRAGAVVTGAERDEIAKELGAGPGSIITITAGAVLAGGTEFTIRNRDTIELRS